MSEIQACTNCDGPLINAESGQALVSNPVKICTDCAKAFWSPYGAAQELPIRKRELREAAAELKRVTEDLVTATTALEAAQAQIAGLKVEVAAMMKQRDEARGGFLAQAMNDAEFRTLLAKEMASDELAVAREERDAALADLSQARAELDQQRGRADNFETTAKLHEDSLHQIAKHVDRMREQRDAAIARAEAEARVRELEARNGR